MSESCLHDARSGVKDKSRILLVDDDRYVSSTISLNLQLYGFIVTSVSDGYNAVSLIEKQMFDLVLLDQSMPGMQGIDVLKQVREKLSMTKLPIVLISSDDRDSTVIEALNSGANDYIKKPINFNLLITRINNQLLMRENNI